MAMFTTPCGKNNPYGRIEWWPNSGPTANGSALTAEAGEKPSGASIEYVTIVPPPPVTDTITWSLYDPEGAHNNSLFTLRNSNDEEGPGNSTPAHACGCTLKAGTNPVAPGTYAIRLRATNQSGYFEDRLLSLTIPV